MTTTTFRFARSTHLGHLARIGATVGVLLAPAFAAHAADYANVVSARAVTTQVAVPQRACHDERQWVQPRASGAGALIGAITGGVIGHQFGGGLGRVATTGLGVVIGSAIGDRVESDGYGPREITVQRCQTVSAYESRLVGYDVVYDYAGRRYSTRLPYDPGARLAIDVRPVGGRAVAPVTGYDEGRAVPPAFYEPDRLPRRVPQGQAPGRIGTPVPSTIAYAAPADDEVGRGW